MTERDRTLTAAGSLTVRRIAGLPDTLGRETVRHAGERWRRCIQKADCRARWSATSW